MGDLLEHWWPLLVGALALYVFIACALVINGDCAAPCGGGEARDADEHTCAHDELATCAAHEPAIAIVRRADR